MNGAAEQMFSRRSPDANTRIGLGVGVFVLDAERRILLEKRSDCGLWGLVGGRVEVGESIAESAVREVLEESGLHVKITRLLGVYSDPDDRIVTYPDNGDVVHKIDVILEASVISGVLSRSTESEELRFFAAGSFPNEICPPARKPVNDYLNGLIGILA